MSHLVLPADHRVGIAAASETVINNDHRSLPGRWMTLRPTRPPSKQEATQRMCRRECERFGLPNPKSRRERTASGVARRPRVRIDPLDGGLNPGFEPARKVSPAGWGASRDWGCRLWLALQSRSLSLLRNCLDRLHPQPLTLPVSGRRLPGASSATVPGGS